jgi:hypothetical protein
MRTWTKVAIVLGLFCGIIPGLLIWIITRNEIDEDYHERSREHSHEHLTTDELLAKIKEIDEADEDNPKRPKCKVCGNPMDGNYDKGFCPHCNLVYDSGVYPAQAIMDKKEAQEAKPNETKPKRILGRSVAITLGITCIVLLVVGLVGGAAYLMSPTTTPSHQAGVIIYRASTNFYDQGGTLKIDVDIGDSGTQATQLIALYVGTSASTLVNRTMTQVPVAPSQVGRITINYDWTSGMTYHFRTLTSSGLVLDWVDQAPVS